MQRETTEFEQQVADFYNAQPAPVQRALDRKLVQVKAMGFADPRALSFMFPGLQGKTIKLKEPK